jgi:hypothetical protein
MEHNNFISLLIIVFIILILYKLSEVELNSSGLAITFYFVILEILAISFDHIYDAFGDWCL